MVKEIQVLEDQINDISGALKKAFAEEEFNENSIRQRVNRLEETYSDCGGDTILQAILAEQIEVLTAMSAKMKNELPEVEREAKAKIEELKEKQEKEREELNEKAEEKIEEEVKGE